MSFPNVKFYQSNKIQMSAACCWSNLVIIVTKVLFDEIIQEEALSLLKTLCTKDVNIFRFK